MSKENLALGSSLVSLSGVGPAKYKLLQESGLSTIADLLDYWPRRYVDYSKLSLIKDISPGLITLKVTISSIKGRWARGRAMHLTEAIVEDNKGGRMPVVWFNQPFRLTSFKPNEEYFLSGEFKVNSGRLNLTNPTVEPVRDEKGQINTARIIPIYPERSNLSSRLLRSLVLQVEEVVKSIQETLPHRILQEYKLISKSEAIWQLHMPESMQALNLAKKRLAFEEILTLQLAVEKNKQFIQKLTSPKIKFNLEKTKEVISSLKFKLTDDQRASAWQILQDLEKSQPMNRMLMGDVGSGKTVVAALSALQAIKAGKQVVVLAPTEVLARQHYKSFTKLLSPNPPSPQASIPLPSRERLGEGVKNSPSRYRNLNLTVLAKELRYKQTDPEKLLWSALRNGQLGAKFRRQYPIDKYILDFYCPAFKLAIELDGGQHNENPSIAKDKERSEILEGKGVEIIRFWNNDVTRDLESVLATIFDRLNTPSPQPSPLKGEGADAATFPKGRTSLVRLLVGSMKPKENKEVLEEIEEGRAELIVGTHALLQEKVKFKDLALVIVDEQHRFGVNQRKGLQKRVKAGNFPHLLTMTATPIPRSLALILYGELDQSILKTKPPGRIEIQTKLIPGASKQKVWDKMKQELEATHAVIIVCPAITDSEASKRVSAEKVFAELDKKAWVKKHGLGLLHGKLKAEEKEQVMSDFASGKINTLVSTTVIEVGIDVPRATLMVIEGAEYFGLAQLHQLRGRVGRSNLPSFCYLVPVKNDGIPARLRYFAENSDGFKLAQYDLEQRGPGQIYGKLQSGALDLRLVDITDINLIKQARLAAKNIIEKKLVLSTELKTNIQKHQDLEYLN